MREERFQRTERKLDGLEAGQTRLEQGHARLEQGQVRLEQGHARLEQRVEEIGITQEDMRDQIKLIAETHASTQDLIRRTSEEILEAIDRRLVPLEVALRNRG